MRCARPGHGLARACLWATVALMAACVPLAGGCSRLPGNRQPSAAFSVSRGEAVVGEEVVFDASASADPDGQIVAYWWEFGDGGSDEGVIASHAYGAPGTFTVTLTVEDNRGAKATAERAIAVREAAGPGVPLVAAFTVAADTVAPFVQLTFDASVSSAWQAEIVEYRWDFGDGGEDEGRVVVYDYADVGVFPVTLTVRDSQGRTAMAERTVTVIDPPPGNVPPAAGFTFSPRQPRVGEEVVFDASASWDDGVIVEYRWDFDDGQDATGEVARHTYRGAGTYVVLLIVVDNFGAEAEAEGQVTVR